MQLRNTDFIECNIQGSDFVNTDLTGSDFYKSQLTRSLFDNTNLTAVNLVEAEDYAIDPLTNNLSKATVSLPQAISLLEQMGIRVE